MLMSKRICKNRMVNKYQVQVILFERTMVPEKKDIKCIEHTCHNSPDSSTMGTKYVIKVPVYNSGNPVKWIIFVELVKKCQLGGALSLWLHICTSCYSKPCRVTKKPKLIRKQMLLTTRQSPTSRPLWPL